MLPHSYKDKVSPIADPGLIRTWVLLSSEFRLHLLIKGTEAARYQQTARKKMLTAKTAASK